LKVPDTLRTFAATIRADILEAGFITGPQPKPAGIEEVIAKQPCGMSAYF
jgi:hypothetical protein